MCFTLQSGHKAIVYSNYLYIGFVMLAGKEIEMEADFEVVSGSGTSFLTGKFDQYKVVHEVT